MNNAERFVNMVRLAEGDISSAWEMFPDTNCGHISRGNEKAFITFHSDESVSIHYSVLTASFTNESLRELIAATNAGVDHPADALWEIIDVMRHH